MWRHGGVVEPGMSENFKRENREIPTVSNSSELERSANASGGTADMYADGKSDDELQLLTTRLNAMPELAGVFCRDKQGKLLFTPTGKPKIAQKRLREVLEALAGEHEIELNRSVKTGVVSLSREFWSQHADIAPFIATWIRLEEVAKLVQFFARLQTDRVYPRYTTIVRTGRTSSSKPNIQQIPRS